MAAGGGYGMAPAGPVEPDGRELWRRRLGAVGRYRWLLLSIVAIGTIGGVIAMRFVNERYMAQATIWIEAATDRTDRGPIRQDGLLAESRAWTELLRSGVVLDPVVQQRRLYVQPARSEDRPLFETLEVDEGTQFGRYRLLVSGDGSSYVLRTDADDVVEQGPLGGTIGEAVGFAWQPPRLAPGSRIEFTVRSPRDVSMQLAGSLQTQSNDQRGSFLRVQLVGDSPEETAATLNGIVTQFVEAAGSLKRAKLDELTEILAEQVAYAENNLKEADLALEAFRIQTITLPSEHAGPVASGLEATRDPVFAQFFDLRITSEQLRREREAIDRVLASPTLSAEGLEAIGSVRSSSALTAALRELNEKRAELRALQFRYTDEHQLVATAAEELRALETVTIPNLARGLQSDLDARSAEIGRQVASAGSELRQIPPRMIEEARLRRQQAIAAELYTNLERRFSEARLAAASSISDVRMLDAAAVPQQPMPGTSKWNTLLLAIGGSLGIGLALVLVLDRIDSKVRYPGQITADLGLPILATVPNLPTKGRTNDPEVNDRLTEAFRSLRFNMLQAYGKAGPVVLAISSPGRGEGKSFVSAHLAMALAATGKRTLLIDGDVRRGSLHRFFDLQRGTGLLECLRHGMRLELARQKTKYENLHLLTGGRRLARGPELLGTSAMHELLAHARTQYDVIIIDTPPFGAGADPFVFGTITGNLLVVLRTGTSERMAMEMHMENLYRLPIRLLGAVMNDVPEGGAYRYYSYSYLPGYEARDEPEGPDSGEMMQLAGTNRT